MYIVLFYYFYVLFWLSRMACGILVPPPGIEARALAVRAQSPNHWTARELPVHCFRLTVVAHKTDCSIV